MASKRKPRPALPPQAQIQVLLDEYRALYSLAGQRMASLERRVPILGAGLTAFLASIEVMSPIFQIGMSVALPVVLLWFVSTTTNHARSLEDLFRRIEEIEGSVNLLAGAELLVFQSRHPSRGKAIGGRVGTGTTLAVSATALLLLASCFYLMATQALLQAEARLGLLTYVTVAGALTMALPASLRSYRYRRSAAAPPPN